MGENHLNTYLAETLFGKTRRAILSVLYSHSDEAYYLRQLSRLIGSGMGAVQRDLKALTAAGILTRIEKGKQIYYQANSKCAVFPELKSLIMKTSGMGDALRVALSPLTKRIEAAFIYGSVARGDESGASDVDILIVGDVTLAEIVAVLNPVQQALNREVNPTVYPVGEFQQKRDQGHHFIKSVIEGKKVFLIGDEHDFAKLAS